MKILKHLSESLHMTEKEIIQFSISCPHRYKIYQISKRNSDEMRTIAHPSKELKIVQRALIEILKQHLQIHPSVYSYRKSLGIKQNANVHVKSNYLLKMDFKNFFPCITPDFLFYSLSRMNIEINETEKNLLRNFLFHKKKRSIKYRLSVGAPSSPLISNFVLYFFDAHIYNECKKLNIKYTRYADDITFSGFDKLNLSKIPDLVKLALKTDTKSAIKVNTKKTIFTSKANNRHVTGITLANDGTISLGRKRKRYISSLVHKYTLNILKEDEIRKLSGLIAYSNHIEPDFCNRLSKKYNLEVLKIKLEA